MQRTFYLLPIPFSKKNKLFSFFRKERDLFKLEYRVKGVKNVHSFVKLLLISD